MKMAIITRIRHPNPNVYFVILLGICWIKRVKIRQSPNPIKHDRMMESNLSKKVNLWATSMSS